MCGGGGGGGDGGRESGEEGGGDFVGPRPSCAVKSGTSCGWQCRWEICEGVKVRGEDVKVRGEGGNVMGEVCSPSFLSSQTRTIFIFR